MLISRKTIYSITGLILLVAGSITAWSPYNRQPALVAGMCIAAGLLVSQLIFRFFWKSNFNWIRQPSYFLLAAGLAAQFIALTAHVIAAGYLPNSTPAFFRIPGAEWFYYGLAIGYAVLLGVLLSRLGEKGIYWGAMGGAILASSTVYIRTFVTPDAGPIYGPVFSMALVILVYLVLNRQSPVSSPGDETDFNIKHLLLRQSRQISFWIITFLILSGISAGLSPAPGESLDYWLRMAVTFLLAIFLAMGIEQEWEWRFIGWLVVFTAGFIGLLFAILSVIVNSSTYGLSYAITARYHPTEFGGANLVARSILIVVPLGIWLIMGTQPHLEKDKKLFSTRIRKLAALGFAILSVLVLFQSHSWEGVFAYLAELIVFLGIFIWVRFRHQIQVWYQKKTRVLIVFVLGIVLAGISLILLFQFASTINATSYNGRLIHWKAALLSFLDAPISGGGLGYSAQFTPYGDQIEFSATSSITLSDPIFVIEITSDYLTYHSHQLFLEVLSGTGLIGFLPFMGMIIVILLRGFIPQPGLNKDVADLRRAAILGIIGAIAWGMLDVLRAMPLFAGGSVWVLLGLLMASEKEIKPSQSQQTPGVKTASVRELVIVGLLAGFLVIIPAIRSYYYTQGYLAYQQRRFGLALLNFQRSIPLDPLNAKNWADIGATQVNLGDYSAALQAYQQAVHNSPNQSNYLTTVGLLNWYMGDFALAEENLKKAVEVDPKAGWDANIWENLALFSVYKGSPDEAFEYFLKSISLNPTLLNTNVWVWVPDANKKLVLGLNQYYLENGDELDKLLMIRLGSTNLDERNLAHPDRLIEPYILKEILDQGLGKYNVLASEKKSPVKLASLVEFARLAGLDDWANSALQQYIAEFPNSVYGLRSQASLRQSSNCLDCAIGELQAALNVSPGDFSTRSQYIRTLMDAGRLEDAQKFYSETVKNELFKPFRYNLLTTDFFQLSRDLARMSQNSREFIQQDQLANFQGNPQDYLDLSEMQLLYGEARKANQNCIRGVAKLIRLNYDPYNGVVHNGALCLAKTDIEFDTLARLIPETENPYLFSIILGMAAMERSQVEQAIYWFVEASRIAHELGPAYTNLGRAYQAINKLENARLEFRQALAVDPWEPLPLLSLADIEFAVSNWEAGLNDLGEAVRIAPGWDEAQLALGNFYLKSGDFTNAGVHFELARRLSDQPDPDEFFDFASNLASASLSENVTEGYLKNGMYEINGVRKFSIFMHPLSTAAYELKLPELEGDETLWLDFSIGMLPESWSQPGDGVNFSITLQTPNQVIDLYSSYIDPKNNLQDRQWKPEKIDLSAYRGQDVTLIFKTDGGEAGDLQFDWAGWGEPAILVAK